jgi:hypothetical protein
MMEHSMRAATLLTFIGIIAQGAAFGQTPPPQSQIRLGPFATTLTDCIAAEIKRRDQKAEALDPENVKALAREILKSNACQEERLNLVSHFDAAKGSGTGQSFLDGAYVDDLPRAVAKRLSGDQPATPIDVCTRLMTYPELYNMASSMSAVIRSRHPVDVGDEQMLEFFHSLILERTRQINFPLSRDVYFRDAISTLDMATTVACFPNFKLAIEENRLAREAHAAERANAERERQMAESEQRKPSNILLMAYSRYIYLRRCFEERTGYATVYLTDVEIDRARKAISGIEKVMLNRDPNIDKDAEWRGANAFAGRAVADYGSCHIELANLLKTFKSEDPLDSALIKDF